MQDIADRVGVHRTTVSNVLNQRFVGVRSDAAARAAEIHRVAHELGYRMNTAARATRTGRTGFLGVLRSPHPACSVRSTELEVGMEQAAHAHGFCLLNDLIDDPAGDGTEAPRIVREDAVDGLIVNYAFGTPPAVRDLIDRCRIPTVWINRKREHDCVRPCDEGAAHEAARYLIGFGHRRIRMVDQDRSLADLAAEEPHYSKADRRAGYERALREAGCTPDLWLLPPSAPGEYLPGRNLHSCVRLLREPEDRPTAVLCGSGLGRVVIAAAWRLGLRVPEDLSVFTFDDDAQADHGIACDRVLVRHRAIGRSSVEELAALLERPDRPRPPVAVPFEFHRTGTVAGPSRPRRFAS